MCQSHLINSGPYTFHKLLIILWATIKLTCCTWLKDVCWKSIKWPLSVFPPPHPVVREKLEDLGKRWESPLITPYSPLSGFAQKWDTVVSACSLAVSQSPACAWSCASRNCEEAQPWQETEQTHWQDARDAELLRQPVFVSRAELTCCWSPLTEGGNILPPHRPQHPASLSDGPASLFQQGGWACAALLKARGLIEKRSDLSYDQSLWWSSKSSPVGELHWLVAWPGSFAALRCNLA